MVRPCPARGGALECGDGITAFDSSGAVGRPVAPAAREGSRYVFAVGPAPREVKAATGVAALHRKMARRGAQSQVGGHRTSPAADAGSGDGVLKWYDPLWPR